MTTVARFLCVVTGGPLLLGAIGTLQFEVIQYRLKNEYGVSANFRPSPFHGARWVTSSDAQSLEKFIDLNKYRLAYDVVNALAILFNYDSELRLMKERWPTLEFHALREHSGLLFQSGI